MLKYTQISNLISNFKKKLFTSKTCKLWNKENKIFRNLLILHKKNILCPEMKITTKKIKNLWFRGHTVLQHLQADQLDIVDQREDHLFGADTPRHADQGVYSSIYRSEK